jgi:uncharacterized membrane protein
MTVVFRLRHIFQVLWSVVGLVAILVVYVEAGWALTHKRSGYQVVDIEAFSAF